MKTHTMDSYEKALLEFFRGDLSASETVHRDDGICPAQLPLSKPA